MRTGFIASTLTFLALTACVTAQGTVYCDQGSDRDIPKAFASQIIQQVIPGNTYGVPGRDSQFTYGPDCLSHSHTGSSSCCQVAYLNTNGEVGTVTMTSNTASTGADSLGGSATGSTLVGWANEILNTCWPDGDNHSGRWAGDGYQVGLSGGTC